MIISRLSYHNFTFDNLISMWWFGKYHHYHLEVREAKMKLEKQKAETIVKLQEVSYLHHSYCDILETALLVTK